MNVNKRREMHETEAHGTLLENSKVLRSIARNSGKTSFRATKSSILGSLTCLLGERDHVQSLGVLVRIWFPVGNVLTLEVLPILPTNSLSGDAVQSQGVFLGVNPSELWVGLVLIRRAPRKTPRKIKKSYG